MMETQIAALQANHTLLMSVRRRLAEAHQLLKHVDLPAREREFIEELIRCADTALSDLSGEN